MLDLVCHICGGGLCCVDDFQSLLQVTSDCRIWKYKGNLTVCQVCGTVQKPVSERWLKEADAIYAGYDIYSQSGGLEQCSFDQLTGAAQSRSAKLVQWLTVNGYLSSTTSTGSLLDIGCGNGAFLGAFGSVYPNWRMTGMELNDRNRSVVEAIPGVESFHIGSIESLSGQFNIITLIHALEHIPDPAQFLDVLKEKLLPSGILIIQTPNLNTNPFDILIADHCTHFTVDTLVKLLSPSFTLLRVQEDYIPKELTVAVQFGLNAEENNQTSNTNWRDKNIDTLRVHMSYLKSLIDIASSVSGEIGVFGTSIAGTWLAGTMKEKVAFFVDEDVSRIGRYHLNLPIVSPDNVTSGAKVLLPLTPAIATKVASRLSCLNCEFLFPVISI